MMGLATNWLQFRSVGLRRQLSSGFQLITLIKLFERKIEKTISPKN